ncbi:MAG: signal peptidase I [Hyphomicrobiales bacterium]|nr:MAG: signal peptidase I [Hyphomicrobiales bacterium]
MTNGSDRPQDDKDKANEGGGFGEAMKIIVQALILALLVRTFLYQPFNIPSGSMMENLLIGDYLFVSKFSYGYSRYSFPFGMVPFSGRVMGSEPERGDIVVFKLPRDNSTDYIKRVIGLPGDKIQVLNSVLYINGKAVPRVRDGEFVGEGRNGQQVRVPRFRETLPNGVSYTVLEETDTSVWDNTPVYEVPAGHYFMMGDNRDNSSDSRATVGYVPLQNLVGRAEVIFFSIEPGEQAWMFWKWPWTVRWDRVFNSL